MQAPEEKRRLNLRDLSFVPGEIPTLSNFGSLLYRSDFEGLPSHGRGQKPFVRRLQIHEEVLCPTTAVVLPELN